MSILINDKSTSDDSITNMMTSENRQTYKNRIEKKAGKCYSCKACGNIFDAHPLMMSTGSPQCIPVGNLTGSSGVTSAADVVRVASCFGTPKYTRTTTMQL